MGKAKSSLSALVTLIFLGAVAAGAYLLLRDLNGPAVSVAPETGGRIGPQQDLALTLRDPSGVRSATVTIRRGAQSLVVLREEFGDKSPEQTVSFNLKEAKLPEGAFELEIKTYDASLAGFGKGNSTTVTLPMRLDSQPPRIAVKTVPPSIRRGGSALILYTVSEDVNKTGVRVGDYFFPGHRQPNGAYACLFPFPYTMTTTDFAPEIMARDTAGNVTSSRLLVNAQGRTFKADTVTVGDRMLNLKADELAALCPEKSATLDQYVCVNNVVRVSNDAKLLEMGRNTSPVFLWDGNFQRLPRSAVKANFGDFRTYMYNGQKIDEQTHTGLDLASVAHADVPAAQAGKVVFTDRLGIYGNMALVDHGLGLMTLYAHLTEFHVQAGDDVKAGQSIGLTGTTGMAVGDHVHFGVLVGGIPVNPIEWLDSKWVRNNISNRINTSL